MELSRATTQEARTSDARARRAVLSSYLGAAIEYYDFILYATASSVVFGPVFFSQLDGPAALVASYATLAVGFIARPLGGIVFGHFGDLLGRKRMLLLSMTVMCVASTLIGLVPAIPTWGAIMLVTLRFVQGLALGGEWGGAALLSAEHASTSRRGFAASFTSAGAPTGTVLGTVALALAGLLPADDFISWGWRIPFLFSAVLLLVGLFVRVKTDESPLFQASTRADRRRPPLVEVLRRPRPVVLAILVALGGFATQALLATYGISYPVAHGLDASSALFAYATSQVIAIPAALTAAWLSDRFGRRPVMLSGLLAMVVLVYPAFNLLEAGRFGLATLALVLFALCHAASFGPIVAFIAEQFPTAVRYTGASVAFQVASVLGAGMTPLVVAALAAGQDGSTTGAMAYVSGLCILSGLVILFLAEETKGIELAS